MLEGLKIGGGWASGYVWVGAKSTPRVKIELTDLPKSGGACPPAPHPSLDPACLAWMMIRILAMLSDSFLCCLLLLLKIAGSDFAQNIAEALLLLFT